MKRIMVAFGTRPEVIKLSPVIRQIIKSQKLTPVIVSTDQHDDLLESALETFNIKPDFRLELFKEKQSPSEIVSNVISKMTELLTANPVDMMVVQGDTSSVLGLSIAAFHHKIPVAHVEAGLRTNNMYSPFPEEMNRILVDHISTLCFAPTSQSVKNLLSENISRDGVIITHGNTVVDALKIAKNMAKAERYNDLGEFVLITAHRRENFKEGIKNICEAVLNLAKKYPKINFVFFVHPNPNVQKPVYDRLGETNTKNIILYDPVPYSDFVEVISKCSFIMTDSGGIQEEAMSFKKPVFILRDETERTELVEMGCGKIVGTNVGKIIKEVSNVLNSSSEFKKMTRGATRYGDGYASNRIVKEIEKFFEQKDGKD
ncbi:MAG: UDP-N-acetylglucosamine 2-epimerase (non-hydrolyzing) [Gammaproteobacteria bacterium]|nr:UDP-N-acetylglucosamine 2-epimerase (non-hydrolyzing) [Gammaproteobacteria bacterium]